MLDAAAAAEQQQRLAERLAERTVVALVGQVHKEKRRSKLEQQQRSFAWDFQRALRANSAFVDITAATGLDVDTVLDPEKSGMLGMDWRVLVLMCLGAGQFWSGPLTLWSSQERIWWDCLQRASDSFSVCVNCLAIAEDRIEVEYGVEGRTARGNAASQATRGFLSPLTEACAAKLMSGSFRTSGDVAVTGQQFFRSVAGPCDSATIRCIVVPLQFAVAIAHGPMRTLMFSARSVFFRPRLRFY